LDALNSLTKIRYPHINIILKVKVKPNCSKSEFSQELNIVFLKSPPQDNKANIELIKLLAKHFKVSNSQIRIVKGLISEERVIEIK
jgi:uncharacterized protein (TIGR00251 family)